MRDVSYKLRAGVAGFIFTLPAGSIVSARMGAAA
ncbi:MAG: hypothetical protein JWO19_4312 [Bryobacterales bacterium]|nr:hypothetical protein [Bryobacterales bacterium]